MQCEGEYFKDDTSSDLKQNSRLNFCLSWISEVTAENAELDSFTNLHLCIENLKKLQESDEKKDKEVADEINVLLCLIAASPSLPNLEELCQDLLHLCQQSILDKKLLYLAFAARIDSDALFVFSEKDRYFWRNDESLCLGLVDKNHHPILELLLLCLKKKFHWLPHMLEVISRLLRKNCEGSVEKLLSHPNLKCLWPIVFLYLIQVQSSPSSLNFSIRQCLQLENIDPSIKMLAGHVKWQLNLLSLVEQEGASVCVPAELYTKNLSALSFLNHSCNILDLGWETTHKLLQKISSDGGYVTDWEMASLSTFWAYTFSLQSILASCQSINMSTAEYKERVSACLLKVPAILCQIKPLDLRIEVIEKLFSLLFLRFEDLQGHIDSDSDDDGEDEANTSIQETVEDSVKLQHYEGVFSSSASLLETDTVLKQNKIVLSTPNLKVALDENKLSSLVSQLPKHGFVCERHVTRDLLKMLQCCLKDIGEFSELTTESLNLYSTDSNCSLQLRVKRIASYVSEALWRLEVLTSTEFIESVSRLHDAGERSIVSSFRDRFSWYYGDDDCTSDDDSLYGQNVSHSRSRSDPEKSSESSSQSNVTCSTYGVTNKACHSSRRRSTSRSYTKTVRDTIIRKMLSSETSLIAQCLVRGEIHTAKHVIQKLKLEQSQMAFELTFAETYHKLQCKLDASAEDYNKDTEYFQNSTLRAIQKAASAGIQASSLNNDVEVLLTDSALPSIPNVMELPSDFLHLLGGPPDEQSIAITGADVALMLSTSTQQALNFLSIASKYSHELRNVHLCASHRSSTVGFLPFVQNLFQAMSLVDSGSPTMLLHRWDVPSFSNRNLKDRLQLSEAMKLQLSDMDAARNRALLFSKFQHLFSSHSSFRTPENKNENNYLQEFKVYLKTFQNVLKSKSAGDGPLTEEDFALLEESPTKLLCNMMFENKILPQDLEISASELGCSLAPILCGELCSGLPSTPPAKTSIEVFRDSNWLGAWILNKSEDIGPARSPSEAVYKLLHLALTELQYQMQVEQNISHSKKGSLSLSRINIERMLIPLSATWELAAVDLNLLKPGAETLAFYCNLATLMWIHSIVFLKSIGCKGLHALFRGSAFQRTAALSSVAYYVGGLGVLTLWDVQRLALSGDLMDPAGTRALCEHAIKIDSCDPFALFVVPTGSRCSPKIQLLQAENLEMELQKSVQEYLGTWVQINSNQVSVPRVINQYIKYTGQNIRNFLLNNCNGLLRNQLNSLSEDAVITVFDDHNAEDCITIHYMSPDIALSEPSQRMWSSKSVLTLDKNILSYFKQNFPLAELLQNICNSSKNEIEDEPEQAVRLDQTSLQIEFPCLGRLCKSPEVVKRSHFFEDNILLTAFHDTVPEELLWKYLNSLVEKRKWETIVNMLGVLPEPQFLGDHVLGIVHDLALMELCVESRGFGEPWKYCELISSVFLRAKLVFGEIVYWPGQICLNQLQAVLQIPQLKSFPSLHKKGTQLKQSISTYQEILNLRIDTPWKSWQEVRELSHIDPETVLHHILSHGNAWLCISWIKLHIIPSFQFHLVDNRVIAMMLNASPPLLQEAEKLLHYFPLKVSSNICLNALHEISSISGLQFCVSFLADVCVKELTVENMETIKLASFGIQMIELMPKAEQIECIDLVSKPHLMLEQLVMNMRLETAERILHRIRPELEIIGPQSSFSIPAIDCMLRQYAEKALEFRIVQGSSASYLSESSCLLTSVSSFSGGTDFVMPLQPPLKSDWVPNEQASFCMNCQITAFSMFNRRHHCRRCGRVVCAQCSPQKMIVEGYGALKVRVCISCYSQTQNLKETQVHPLSEQQDSVSPSSKTSIFSENIWRLTHSSALNDTVKGEFGYENAPSVSLCLAILNLHSESAACPNFLVDSCETILKYLQPQGGLSNPEVDYGLVIEMCRSLVIAAKVKCAQWGYVSDEPNYDQRLSKIDLIGLLISHGCTALIPNETSSHGLRRLQTQLLEEELWELALEVSTKGGMERNGVWSAWGKGCLRAGRWEDAREKFTHCFPNKRSTSNPPLLLEILQILESTHYSMDKEVLQKAETLKSVGKKLAPSPAVAVLHSLSSLKNISQGKFPKVIGAKGCLDPLVYDECCYYLQKYGSHSSYLRFLVRHSDLKEALLHVLDNSVDPQLFFDWVYMPCLKMGQITPLHCSMTAIDSSLRLWKAYLHGVCAALERRSLLHTLYEVQQWSKDHVRAAMTCIRFYCQNARSYSDLFLNINYLMRAQSHLEAAQAVSTLPSKGSKLKSGSSSSPNSGAEIDESEPLGLQLTSKELDHHLSTIWRQIEITKFLKNCEGRLQMARQWFPQSFAAPLVHGLPTLFGNMSERKILAGLCILCGKNVEEGFGIAYRILEGFDINAQDVYEAVAIALYRSGRLSEVQQLTECIHSSGISDAEKVCNSVLYACISHASKKPGSGQSLDVIIKNITDPVLKISAFIKSGQLKSAYLLAVKLQRLDDIERILEEADRSGQTSIKSICLKRLGRL